ncbi:ShlB/FhaC/HecB family hemolysin secretion/activation protein [Variovorax terrae]|uniref:ShlB/FhaC/HecB family hemolysin secretion/activation protein n=1 Tax=Variovorax terrae TaxID=2923278 RepID=A0A9X1VV21_9BURK|nr:POTRA domain-containing protein [Variovorax terrae]MCJ0763917.1 ShlB/FhaC/HecB family hemolysin secretion/activation protein [Variovorax terrae]
MLRALTLLFFFAVMGTAVTPPARAQAGSGNPLDTLPRAQEPRQGGVATEVVPPPSPFQALRNGVITPSRFDVEGVQSIPFDDVAGRFAPLAGQSITIGRLLDVAQEVTQLYQQRGYALSFCFIPQQDFKDGVVRIIAVEGHVSEVRIEGEAGRARPKIRDMAEHIRQDKPLRQQTFDRYIQLLGQLPGLSIQASAPLPVNTDGATVLTLKVSSKPYSVSVGLDSYQSKPRALVTGILNNPLAAGSQLRASAMASTLSEEEYYAFQYSQWVGSEGLSFKIDASHYQGNPDAQFNLDTGTRRKVTNDRLEWSASYPLALSKTMSMVASAGAYGVNYTDDYANPVTAAAVAYDTRVRAVFGQLSYTLSQPDRARRLSVMLVRGLDAAGALARASTNVPGLMVTNPVDLDFTRVLFQGSQSDSWPARIGTVLSMALQYSPNALPTTERVSFGGLRWARGYAPGETSGDSGWGVGFELNRRYAWEIGPLKQIQPYVLLESARVYNKQGTPVPARLNSVAFGARLSDQRYYSLDLSLAKPTGELPIENPARHLRWNASLNYQLNPP